MGCELRSFKDPEILAQDQRSGHTGFTEASGAQHTAVAAPAGRPPGARIVAAGRQPVIQTQLDTAPDDLGFRHRDARGVHPKTDAFDAGAVSSWVWITG